ncbi:VanW family protein [Polyangium sp. y55x31]|uniref:VanW family protein n=1 Tax=Polyangium sp. y55x31 TaxID=3042688 RepID=UPI002482852E|nr:VanW family protein [Polyangium sp. y55x31]MDI1483916.1 VanW family protein [Polyangium sp. y55x31]
MSHASAHSSSTTRRPRRNFLLRGALAMLVAGAGALSASAACRSLLPAENAIAKGVRIGGVDAGSGSPREVAERQARALLDRRVTLVMGEEVALETSLAELGATVDEERLAARLSSVGREGDLFTRLADALSARRGDVSVPVFVTLPIEPLAAALERRKDEADTPPRGARLDFATGKPTPHVAGQYLDLYAAASAIERAAQNGETRVPVPTFEILPDASSEVVASIDVSRVITKYETRFGYLGGQANRAQNVARAAAGIDGVVLLPGEIKSFNAEVGARTKENGFTTAPEIFKGEMREGIGGGTCQVASTLHAAAYLGGFEITERINHSRPSGYIPMGLDATVVYPHVDLKLKNPYTFPVVVHAVAQKGILTVEMRGSGAPADVEWSSATIGVSPYKRKIEESAYLTEGHVVLKQKGIRGYQIKKTRVVKSDDGRARVEEKTDVYPPTFEILIVPPGLDPATLPPLPGEEAERQSSG